MSMSLFFLLLLLIYNTALVISDVATAAAVKLFLKAAAVQIKYDSLTQRSM